MSGETLVAVDTNILICAEDAADPAKRQMAIAWLDHLWRKRIGRVSNQALNEFYVNVTRKIQPPMPQGDARAKVRRYAAWNPWQVDQATIETAWGLEANHRLHYWDSLMLAAAQHMGCAYVLSEDMGHNQRYGAVTVVNPFTQPIQWLYDL